MPGVGSYYVVYGGAHQGIVKDRARAMELLRNGSALRCRRFASKLAAEASLEATPCVNRKPEDKRDGENKGEKEGGLKREGQES